MLCSWFSNVQSQFDRLQSLNLWVNLSLSAVSVQVSLLKILKSCPVVRQELEVQKVRNPERCTSTVFHIRGLLLFHYHFHAHLCKIIICNDIMSLRFEVILIVSVIFTVFWDVMSCSVTDTCQHWYPSNKLHSITFLKSVISIASHLME